jgi:hypothetical protein
MAYVLTPRNGRDMASLSGQLETAGSADTCPLESLSANGAQVVSGATYQSWHP